MYFYLNSYEHFYVSKVILENSFIAHDLSIRKMVKSIKRINPCPQLWN